MSICQGEFQGFNCSCRLSKISLNKQNTDAGPISLAFRLAHGTYYLTHCQGTNPTILGSILIKSLFKIYNCQSKSYLNVKY